MGPVLQAAPRRAIGRLAPDAPREPTAGAETLRAPGSTGCGWTARAMARLFH